MNGRPRQRAPSLALSSVGRHLWVDLLTAGPAPLTDPIARLQSTLARRYTIERELGSGGMGSVYLALDRKHRRRVALKVLPPDLAMALGTDRFLREIEIVARLSHPNVVPLHDSGQAAGLLYYVMPFVDGESLRDRLRREDRLPVGDAITIAREVGDAVGYAHGMGVVHRDIKPGNILLSSGHARLSDFGIARAARAAGGEKLTESGLRVGTTAYMSPEQASGAPDVDGRSDIYSLGCVLYEMLAGAQAAEPILAGRFSGSLPGIRTLRPETPEAIEQALHRALAPSRADRFATAAEFVQALAAPTHSGGSELVTVKVPNVRRRRWVAVGAALAAGLALAIGSMIARRPALDRNRILVSVFANQSGDTTLAMLGQVATDYVARALAATGLVEVLDQRLEEGGTAAPSRGDLALTRALARRRHARLVVWGGYFRDRDSIRFQAQITDTETGELLRSIAPVAADVGAATHGAELLRQGVMAALAPLVDPRFASFAVAASRPASYEAYREFLAGEELGLTSPCAGPDCPDDALLHYRRAVALDSSFTLPAAQAAVLHWYRSECRQTDSIARDLLTPLRAPPPVDRALLEWARDNCAGRRAAAFEALRREMTAAPQSEFLIVLFARMAWLSGRPREALAALDRLDQNAPKPHRFVWQVRDGAYHMLSDYRRELQHVRRARALFPQDLEMMTWEAQALAGLGRVEEAVALTVEMERVPRGIRQNHFTRVLALVVVGNELMVHGYREEARALFERAVIRCNEHPDERAFGASPGIALYGAGRWAEAERHFQDADAAGPEVHNRGFLAAVAAQLGDSMTSARMEGWLSTEGAKAEAPGWATFYRARAAAIEGRRERAVELLRLALDEGFGYEWGNGMHSDPDLLPLRGYAPYEELTGPRE